MFRKYNKKIITAILVVIVSVGLIGPGILLIFENPNQDNSSPNQVQVSPQPEETNPKTATATSSAGL